MGEVTSSPSNPQMFDFTAMPVISKGTFAEVYDGGYYAIKRVDLTHSHKSNIRNA